MYPARDGSHQGRGPRTNPWTHLLLIIGEADTTGAAHEDWRVLLPGAGTQPTQRPDSRTWARQTGCVVFDDRLADRIRELVGTERGLTEQRMFGGLAFLVNGNLAVSASGQGGLLVRVDPAETEKLVQRPHVEAVVMRGRPMPGWLRIAPEGVRTKRQLQQWAARGVAYARSLPPKR